jgi:hypothetical protein
MGRIDYLPVADAQSSRHAVSATGQRRRARAVLGWVTFEPGLQSQLLEAEALVRRLPREADAAGMLRLAFLARDRELLDAALTSARAAERKHGA